MCESTAYVKRGGREEKLMGDVAHVAFEGESLVLTGILGERLQLRARVVDLDLVGHRILLEER